MTEALMRVKLIDGGRKFQTINQEFVNGAYIPPGFICDYASVPRGLHWLIPPAGARYTKAAMLHDYAYYHHGLYASDGSPPTSNPGIIFRELTRKEADQWFLGAMGDTKVKWWRKWAMYGAVRLFGRKAWNK